MTRQLMPAEAEGKVFLLLEPDEARNLARLLAHYEALLNPDGQRPLESAEGYDPTVWHQVLLKLLQQAASAELEQHMSSGRGVQLVTADGVR